MTKVAVVGANGKMGTAICAAVEDAGDLELVARVTRGDVLKSVFDAQAEVLVDVTNAGAAVDTLKWAALHGVPTVVGTSGLTGEQMSDLHRSFSGAGVQCFVVPNFSLGAVLMMRMAELAVEYFPDVEIVELHRADKPDAPSGTARATARRLAERRTGTPVSTDRDSLARGELIDGIPVHAVRLPGLLAHQEVIFGATGETLVVRHDSIDRSSFMPGALRAIRGVRGLPEGLTVGLEAVLPQR
jgi:4-hydroxy-tetrahydrodipicolinate reductase